MKKFISLIFAGTLLGATSIYASTAAFEAEFDQAGQDVETAVMNIVNFVGLPEDILALRGDIENVSNSIAQGGGNMVELVLDLQNLGNEFQQRTQDFMDNRAEGSPVPTAAMRGVYL